MSCCRGTGGDDAPAAMLKYEAEGLSRMAAAAPSLRVPKPWLAGEVGGGKGFIVMDHIEMDWRGER